ncbi:flagellar hook-length control protein FliK [Aquisalimonas sp. 2447]|uniref:flagellar hook-length control protein FliK n=1 Tax=Aquisalimonas sp. 2447 TaxID=2740807 RepID=UPI0014324054|nr:flagellar hook-length control protein FliK [Aquisalimonas sp. 2447]QIT55679.1 flagellar hook-length control protein FliK [Aquisalimonas sp. 2447]
MLPPPVAPQAALLRVAEPPAGAARALQPGQVLDAVARSVTRDGQVTLQLGNQALQARTDQPLQAGQPLQVQVVRQDSDTLMLRVLPTQRASESSEAMRGLLARQAPPNALAANAALATQEPSTVRQLPDQVQQALRQYFQALPEASQVSRSDGLRQAVADSGLHLERRLAAVATGAEPPTTIRGDQKGQLTALVNQVFKALDARPRTTGSGDQPLPPAAQGRTAPATPPPPPQLPSLATPGGMGEALTELARQADGALARTQLHQLALLAGDALPFFFELPVRDGRGMDLLQFRMDRDGEGDDQDGERTWRVMVSFNFERLGPMHAVIHLSTEAVATTWWAEHPATARFLERHMETLTERLQDAGLRVANMTCAQGRPPMADNAPGEYGREGFINEQA